MSGVFVFITHRIVCYIIIVCNRPDIRELVMQLSDFATVRIAQALEPAIRLIGERSADAAALTLINHGIETSHMQLEDIMAVSASARIGTLAAIGFFNYVPLEERFSLAADRFAETCRDPTAAARTKKAALIYDALLIDLHNFTPMYQMINSAITTNIEDMVFPPVQELKPCSEGAIRWARELDSPLHYAAPALSVPMEELKPLATKVAIEAIKEKELMGEDEMALLLSIPAKTLGNRRRGNEVNRSVLIQKKPNATVRYHKTKALAALQNGTFFVTPKYGTKR